MTTAPPIEYDLEQAKKYLAQSEYADTYQSIELDCFLLDAAPALEKMMLSRRPAAHRSALP